MNYDKLRASTPINAQAARVTGGGEQYVSRKIVTTADSPNPIPTIPTPVQELDLTGIRFGRLTVMGRACGAANSKGAPWAVRCSCGTWSIRRTKAVKNPANADDRCEQCRHVAFLREASSARSAGKYRDGTAF